MNEQGKKCENKAIFCIDFRRAKVSVDFPLPVLLCYIHCVRFLTMGIAQKTLFL